MAKSKNDDKEPAETSPPEVSEDEDEDALAASADPEAVHARNLERAARRVARKLAEVEVPEPAAPAPAAPVAPVAPAIEVAPSVPPTADQLSRFTLPAGVTRDAAAAMRATLYGRVEPLENRGIPEDLPAEIRKMLEELDAINGQDAYSTETAALGALKSDEFLALPRGADPPIVHPSQVGSAEVHRFFSYKYLAQVYALNKAKAPAGEDAIKYGFLRMEAVKMGWFAGQREIVKLAAPGDALATMAKDFNSDVCSTARLAAWLIPLAAEHRFRQAGHHYITGQTAEYEEAYRKVLQACLAPHVHGWMKPATLYHHALHWISPARARSVAMAQLESTRIPDAIKTRINAAPAGTALVTTSAAVIAAMEAAGLAKGVGAAKVADLAFIQRVAAAIKSSPVKYHKMPHAFGSAPASKEELDNLEEAKVEAAKLAPISQAFIDAYLPQADLGRAKAIRKYATENPLLLKQATSFFRKLGRVKVKSLDELFATSLPGAGKAKKEEEKEEEEEEEEQA